MRTTAPPQLYERPHVQLLRILREARGLGLSFEEAWVAAIRPGRAIVMATTPAAPALAIRWPTDRTDRETWREVICSSREAWRRAYDAAAPTPPERALVALGETLSVLDRVAQVAAVGEGIGAGADLVLSA